MKLKWTIFFWSVFWNIKFSWALWWGLKTERLSNFDAVLRRVGVVDSRVEWILLNVLEGRRRWLVLHIDDAPRARQWFGPIVIDLTMMMTGSGWAWSAADKNSLPQAFWGVRQVEASRQRRRGPGLQLREVASLLPPLGGLRPPRLGMTWCDDTVFLDPIKCPGKLKVACYQKKDFLQPGRGKFENGSTIASARWWWWEFKFDCKLKVSFHAWNIIGWAESRLFNRFLKFDNQKSIGNHFGFWS